MNGVRYFVIRMSTGEYLTNVQVISNYIAYEFTADRTQASSLNDLDSQLILKRLRTLGETRARREELTIPELQRLPEDPAEGG